MEKNNIDILFNGWVIDTNGVTVCKYDFGNDFAIDREEAIKTLIEQKYFGWGAVATFYKKDIIKHCKFDKDIKFGEDFYFKYQTIKISSKLYYAPINAYHYVRRETSATKSYSIGKRMDDLKVIKRVMHIETSEISDFLYFKEYIPRVIEYAIMSISSTTEKNKKFAQKFKNEALENFHDILFSPLTTRNTKMKLMILRLHPVVIKIFGKIYMRRKKITCD